jgi:hypothetical protein
MNTLAKALAAFVLMLLFSLTVFASAQDPLHHVGLHHVGLYHVLVIHSFRSSLPVNTDWYKGTMRAFTSQDDMNIEHRFSRAR